MTGLDVPDQLPRTVVYERDDDGAPLAIEVVSAPRWQVVLAEAPPEDADVRVVLLESGRVPEQLPDWLAVEAVPPQVAELGPETGPYSRTMTVHAEGLARRLGTRLHSAQPRQQYESTLADFLAAGAVAVRHPAPVPAEAERRRGVISAFCRRRAFPLGALGERTGLALEWWLARHFETPDALAEALLLERVRDAAPQLAASIQALRGATVPEDEPAYAELALDRRALLSQATPWRYVEGADMAPALAALRAWSRRYTAAFEVHATAVRRRATEVRLRLERDLAAARALERLDSIRALGPPVGANATLDFRAALHALEAFEPTPQSVPLGRQPALFEQAAAAATAVRAALETQRARLATATVGRILDQPGADALTQLLAAIQATNLDGIERALDPRLAAHIEKLLTSEPAAARATSSLRTV